ncbi:MAG: hypothetical protein JO154_10325 [Chitinophaga sp.]|uniref:DUF5694 domain-containing protein n=1 Tax=Chitinophaga sp. TaxID=1869181 RepID=UPI0025BDF0FB|nr:DUF5694 domain-containing protein [Chitinophaga sp.]MBV8252990.1 hypothetical protein [Chitinophaga sp.]
MLRNSLFSIILLAVAIGANAQQQSKIKSSSSFFPDKKAQVLVVGSFHMDYPGLDAHKTADQDKVDVLKEPKKSEVTELVNYIKKFKPTKIAIEAWPQWNATEKLRKYNQGEYRDKRDERFQIAIRLASELKLDTLYSIDADGTLEELTKMDTTYFKNLLEDFDYQSNDSMTVKYHKLYDYKDKLAAKTNLLQYFKYINSKESHRVDYGAYLVGDFKLGEYRGADIIALDWYDRNLRIFRNLQRITSGPNDRILMLFGNGHAAILRQLLESSPEYHFVEFDSLK